MRKQILAIVALFGVAYLLAGCATVKPIGLDSSFWQQKELRIGVAVAKHPEPGVFMEGSQGLLDMAIAHAAMQDVREYLRKIDLNQTGFSQIRDRTFQQLRQRGMPAKKFERILDLDALEKFTTQGTGDYFEKDLRSLGRGEDIDILLLFSIEAVGLFRHYSGFFPHGPPQALFQAKGHLIDLRSNELKWRFVMQRDEGLVAVLGEWSQPPDYPNLTRALQRAVNQAVEYLETQFFGEAKHEKNILVERDPKKERSLHEKQTEAFAPTEPRREVYLRSTPQEQSPEIKEQAVKSPREFRETAGQKKVKLIMTDLVSTDYSREGMAIFERLLKERLLSLGYFAVDNEEDLRIEVRVTEFDPGSRLVRFFGGFGAGKAVLSFLANFKDRLGTPISQVEGGKSYTGMELIDNPVFKSEEGTKNAMIRDSVAQIAQFIRDKILPRSLPPPS